MITIEKTDKNHPIPNHYYIMRGEGPHAVFLTPRGNWENHCLNGYYKTLREAEEMLDNCGLSAQKPDKTESFNLGGALWMANSQIELFLNNIIARSEAVLAEAEKRILHKPTVEFFRGQKICAEQALQVLGKQSEPDEIIHGEIVNGVLRVYNEQGQALDLIFGDNEN